VGLKKEALSKAAPSVEKPTRAPEGLWSGCIKQKNHILTTGKQAPSPKSDRSLPITWPIAQEWGFLKEGDRPVPERVKFHARAGGNIAN